MGVIIIAMVIVSLSFLSLLFLVLWIKSSGEVQRLQERFAGVIDIEAEARNAKADLERIIAKIKRLQHDYRKKRRIYERLRDQVAVFDEQLSFSEFGIYEPHFDFGDSESYKDAIKAVRGEQRDLVKAKAAVSVFADWRVEGSKAKGQAMANRAVKLALRAFNAEADAAIANTRWNNAEAMLRRVGNARTQIDKANMSLKIEITQHYFDLKLKELRLTHEYREKLKVERNERAEEARLKREEQRLEKEAAEARREEEKYEAMLAKARAEIGAGNSEEQVARIAELEKRLAEAHEATERAQALAERTKTGYVYIVSNVGSFGEGVVKIGLTRRLDPADRVRELGDASVPFLFDTHAMIYSEEAPALEAALHSEFGDRRINSANMRKEFFRATLEEVEEAVRRLAPGADFHKDIEAQEFRETMARRKEKLNGERLAEEFAYPEVI